MPRRKLARIAEAEKVQGQAQAAIVERLDDERFVAGFGSNGGEEFLSYMNIAESLVVKGGDEWKRWDAKMTANLDRVQNDDGSWSGPPLHHRPDLLHRLGAPGPDGRPHPDLRPGRAATPPRPRRVSLRRTSSRRVAA